MAMAMAIMFIMAMMIMMMMMMMVIIMMMIMMIYGDVYSSYVAAIADTPCDVLVLIL